MQFGIQMVFQNFDRANSGVTDGQVYDEEIRLGLLATHCGPSSIISRTIRFVPTTPSS